ncbi:hypothetical protein IFO69_09500 [Echinicola sp. CAU 1574]|uniref:Uncharacterized protein n=1 Tax=Echinicola arenosa TaxID=2774144 RepID=A0ABR9AJL0_9BACT|nr:hypothetical protein [Echinicola arenosa]MBD8488978.1 hypothetical protein [Echinicola arenosa]
MRNLLFILFGAILCVACNRSAIPEPIWLNKKEIFGLSDFTANFLVEGEEWEGILFTSSQPIILEGKQVSGKLRLSIPMGKNLIGGPANLELRNGKHAFYYPLWLKVDTVEVKWIEFRSPKTVNTDSVLMHQQLVYKTDGIGNILKVDSDLWFKERSITLSEEVGVYPTSDDEPLKAFYVQPGSPTAVPLMLKEKEGSINNDLIVGPMKDRYGNLLADGTLVKIILKNDTKTWLKEIYAKDGMANMTIERGEFDGYEVLAMVYQVKSNIIKIL